MGFNKSFYIKAEAEIKARKAANNNIIISRQKEISKKFPDYVSLREELAGTGGELISILGAQDVAAQIKKLSEKNLGIQARIETLLLENGYPRDYLNPIHTCLKCKDSGIYEGIRCDCFLDIVKRFAANELNQSSPIKLSSFDVFDLRLYPDEKDNETGRNIRKGMAGIFEYCKQFADDFHLPCNGILMRGNTGLGKTHLSLAIAGEVLKKGYSVIYGSAPDLFRRIEKEHFNSQIESDTLGLLQNTELLVLDDLGSEFDSQFYVSTLYNLLNFRMNRGLAVIVSTNLDLKSLQKRYNDRVVSRLLTLEGLDFFGRDIRIYNKILR
ncbi:MAG: ATP-binding protein [Eubacterium sp.]|jgi:DNA replication protein DnaC|nr:ATP-binding protein [Eubacterium sp.]